MGCRVHRGLRYWTLSVNEDRHVLHLVRPWRLAAFLVGVLSTTSVFTTPLAHVDHQSLTGHMVQHLLLMTLAAPLLLLGQPGIILRCSLLRPLSDRLSAQVGQCPIRKLVRFFTRPALGWLAGTFCVIFWHIPIAFALGRRSAGWQQFELATFLAGGLLFWRPVIQHWQSATKQPPWSIPLYLFLATLPCDALSAFLTFCGRAVYSGYESGPRLFDNAPLQDQEFAGSLMWVWVTFVYLVPAVSSIIQRLSVRNPATAVEPWHLYCCEPATGTAIHDD
jgi:putative membrane protein